MKQNYVYILTNKPKGVLYIGITSDLVKRIYEHKNQIIQDSFTSKYKLKRLVLYETYDDPENAIKREKQLKNWHRDWKINFIEKTNPTWKDLSWEMYT